MELNVFTPLPPCTSLICYPTLMNFYNKRIMTDDLVNQCNTFYDEMLLDRRINFLRETNEFKDWVPEEKSYTLCIWLRDDMGGYYSPGKMVIDETYLVSNGAERLLNLFRNSLQKEGNKMFEYIYSSSVDNEKFGNFLILLRHTLEMKGYKASQKVHMESDFINIIDNRI